MSYDREKLTYKVGARVREYRVQRGMSQENLALTSGIHPDFLGKLERGERCPSVDTLYKICEGLKISMSRLLDFDGDIRPTCDEARYRIDEAVNGLTDEEAVELAEIIEDIVKFKYKK